jgi:carbamoyltransferase
MYILGISAFYHDSAAVLIKDGKIIAAVQEERFSRKKHDERFPKNAILYCLKEANISLSEIAAFVFYDKPFMKFERIIQTLLETAPKGLPLFFLSMPVWLKEKLFLKDILRKELKKIHGKKLNVPLLFSSHHLSHAASAFYASPLDEATILTIDGVGEWATASIAYGSGKNIDTLKEMHFPHSLGLLYSAFTYFIGFKVNEGEYKVMGLAPYADPNHKLVKKYGEIIENHLVDLKEDGSLSLNLGFFSYTHTTKMLPKRKWENLFNIPFRKADSPLTKEHAALAAALQLFTEKVVMKMAIHAVQLTGNRNLCLAGGVALNCVSNGKMHDSGHFDSIYVQPAAGDAGGALGAALAAYHMHYGNNRTPIKDFMEQGALGPAFLNDKILIAIKNTNLHAQYLADDDLYETCAALLAKGNVVGWFCGRMEFGPRALGNRSILADPANAEMQRTLNLKIKKRESFRPFAPIMLEKEAYKYFEKPAQNAYMLFVHKIKEKFRISRPPHFYQLPFVDMLSYVGSEIPAVTHIDYTTRIQAIPSDSPAKIRHLLEYFEKLTSRAMLINTSFNVKDEPIVCSPEDAIRCFLQTEMDILVLENYVIYKNLNNKHNS